MAIKKPLNFMDIAQTFYGEAFDVSSKRALGESMAEWEEMEEGERSFAQAHLLYLGLQAQAQTHALLGHVRGLLDELAEAFTVALEAGLAEQGEDEDAAPFDEELADAEPPPMIIDAEPAKTEAT